ncbi:S-layer homology domain-containing protein [Sporosarcina sp. 179-K 3D1 HS]|uniref:CAP and S-layer homology domain-containing protein n=1 Tax=Sporosarcina sp. 179-K 3D1 HS TaxID=3232169 RepID=UPI0039A03E88
MKKLFTIAMLSLTLVISPLLTQAASFSDVPRNHWAYEAIDQMSERGLINGYPDGTYRLNNPVTRAQAAKIVALAIGAKASPNFKTRFQDVGPAHGSYNYIRALTERGIFNDADQFRPNDPLTRAQMAKILTLGYEIIVDDNDFIRFRDVTKQSQYYGYITTIAELGITTTPPGGTFQPNDQLSRAHMAAFIQRAMEFEAKRQKGLIHYDQAQKLYIETNSPVTKPPVAKLADNASKTMELVNEQRTKQGGKPLTHDRELSKVAQAKAEDMAKNDYFSHTSPTYGSVEDMLSRFNYKWTAYGENIAMGYTTPVDVITGWMNSTGHRANILKAEFTHIGSGYATNAQGTTYWVHQFSRK